MDFRQAIKTLNRMCDGHYKKHNCRFCPFEHYAYNDKTGCLYYILSNPERAEDLLLEWMEDNQIETNEERLKKIIRETFTCEVEFDLPSLYSALEIKRDGVLYDTKNWLLLEYGQY